MNEAHKRFQEIFEELYSLSVTDKVKFLESLLFNFTIAGRGLWSDSNATDAEKADAYKWLHELLHRIWNIRFELQANEDNDSITLLYENMKFYGEQSGLLQTHLVPTIIIAFTTLKK